MIVTVNIFDAFSMQHSSNGPFLQQLWCSSILSDVPCLAFPSQGQLWLLEDVYQRPQLFWFSQLGWVEVLSVLQSTGLQNWISWPKQSRVQRLRHCESGSFHWVGITGASVTLELISKAKCFFFSSVLITCFGMVSVLHLKGQRSANGWGFEIGCYFFFLLFLRASVGLQFSQKRSWWQDANPFLTSVGP